MTSKVEERAIAKTALSDQLHSGEGSALQRYRQKAAGDVSLPELLRYELSTLFFGNLGGGLGYLLRKRFYSTLFRTVGSGIILGKGVVLRYPKRISLGQQVAIDDYVLLDASGAGEEGIHLGDRVIISRNCVIQGKSGPVVIGEKTDIGCNTIITSVSGIHLDRAVLIAGNCYLGGARYFSDRLARPIMDQGIYSKGPVRIGEGSWLGAGAVVLDGVQIGRGCIVGAGAVVTKELPDYAIAAGVPAQIIRMRQESDQHKT